MIEAAFANRDQGLQDVMQLIAVADVGPGFFAHLRNSCGIELADLL